MAAKQEYARHRLRERMFGAMLPASSWDILLDLYVAGAEGRTVSIKAACFATSVPQTTALRHVAQLVELGLVKRSPHPSDCRSSHLKLTEHAVGRMRDYLGRLSNNKNGPATA